jgi:hypothetical protein
MEQLFGGGLPPASQVQQVARPDIYYIVLDGYGRQDTLREHYGHNNSRFSNWLQSRGFIVGEGSLANYCQTTLSLASTLNMEYLDSFAEHAGTDSDNRQALSTAMQEGRVLTFLRDQEYQVVALRSGYWPTEFHSADVYLQPRAMMSEFEAVLLESSPPGVLLQAATGWSGYDNHRTTIRFVLDELPRVVSMKSPKFVFAHLVCPHPPFVFNASGQPARPPGGFRLGDGRDLFPHDVYRAGYAEQIQFVNNRLRQIVEAIQKESAVPPVIILQGDHGPGMNWDPMSLRRTDVRDRFSTLNAISAPGIDPASVELCANPVNTFRVILSHLFAVDLKPLPHRSYYSTWPRPLDFVEVTEEL